MDYKGNIIECTLEGDTIQAWLQKRVYRLMSDTDAIALIQRLDTLIENLHPCRCVLPDPVKVGVLVNALSESNYKEWKRMILSYTTTYSTYDWMQALSLRVSIMNKEHFTWPLHTRL
jgi:hypothetical protein